VQALEGRDDDADAGGRLARGALRSSRLGGRRRPASTRACVLARRASGLRRFVPDQGVRPRGVGRGCDTSRCSCLVLGQACWFTPAQRILLFRAGEAATRASPCAAQSAQASSMASGGAVLGELVDDRGPPGVCRPPSNFTDLRSIRRPGLSSAPCGAQLGDLTPYRARVPRLESAARCARRSDQGRTTDTLARSRGGALPAI